MSTFKNIFAILLVFLTAAALPDSVEAGTSYNSAPVVSGTPATKATVGSGYKFLPKATDANGDKLTFSILNKPRWASFSTSTGLLSGIPSATGITNNIIIYVTDGTKQRSLPAFSIRVVATSSASSSSSTANVAPTISGTPSTSVTAGKAYSFKPTAADANSDALGFSIANKPGWASFNSANGQLSGTPSSSNVSSYASVTISVSDGKASASLSPFTLTVVAAPITTGSASLTWTSPRLNTDGTALTNLAAYKIYYGTSSSSLGNSVIVGAGLTSYTIGNLANGTWYFAISSINSAGTEGNMSNAVSNNI